MGKAPDECPLCGEFAGWVQIDAAHKGFSVGKAAVGGVVLGPVGLLGGALGKKKVTYLCKACNFQHEYSGSISDDF